MAKQKAQPGDNKGDQRPKAKRVTTKLVQQTQDQPPPAVPDVPHKPEVDDADPIAADGLNDRRRLFVHYVVAGNSLTKAAELAGYKSDNRDALKVTASRLLTFPNVRAALARERALRADSIDDAKLRLIQLSHADMNNFLRYDENGEVTVDLKQAAELGVLGQLKEIYQERVEVDGVPGYTVKTKVKVHDPRPSLETRLKLYGALFERHHHTGTVQVVHQVMAGVMKDPEAFAAARLLTRRTTELKNQENGSPSEGGQNG